MELILWPGCVTCGLLAVSGYAQMARANDGWREAAGWTAPLVFTSAALALLVALGTLALVPWALIALAPLAVVAARSAGAWREIAKLKGPWAATAAVLGLLAARIRHALWNAREDLRDILHVRREAAAAAGTPYSPGADPAALNGVRTVPSLREDASLGRTPAPGEVAAALVAAEVPVPVPWRATTEWAAEFEPDSEDEFREHAAEEAAGLLTYAEGARARAETLLTARGLHPAVIAGELDFADEVAELASTRAAAIQRYDGVYGVIGEWHEEGNELPHDARGWWGDGGGAPAA